MKWLLVVSRKDTVISHYVQYSTYTVCNYSKERLTYSIRYLRNALITNMYDCTTYVHRYLVVYRFIQMYAYMVDNNTMMTITTIINMYNNDDNNKNDNNTNNDEKLLWNSYKIVRGTWRRHHHSSLSGCHRTRNYYSYYSYSSSTTTCDRGETKKIDVLATFGGFHFPSYRVIFLLLVLQN